MTLSAVPLAVKSSVSAPELMVSPAAAEPVIALPCVVGSVPSSAAAPVPPVIAMLGPLFGVMVRTPRLCVTETRVIWLFVMVWVDGFEGHGIRRIAAA